MTIIDHNWSWAGSLTARPATNAIVLHHAALVTASADDIHTSHKNQGWSGIGYHYYVRKDGTVHRGRPEWAIGAHVLRHNNHTIGVCAEGNYEAETAMPAAQKAALRQLVAMLRAKYPGVAVKRHSDYMATACPGRYYPFDAITAQQTAVPAANNDQEDDDMATRYNTVQELPAWAQQDIQTLIDKGHIRGRDGGALDLTEDMVRTIIICARMLGVL